MKRGLKASTETKLCDLSSSYNHYPDEKGTESSWNKAKIEAAISLQPLPR